MTTDTITPNDPEPAEEAAEVPALANPPAEPEPADDSDTPGRKASAEAARYRKQLRTAEGDLEATRGHVTELQQEVVRMLTSSKLANPDDLTTFVPFDSLLGDDGKLDQGKIDTALAALLEERPYLAAPPRPIPGQQQQIRRGAPVTAPGVDERSSVEKAFGTSSAKWSDIVGRHADREDDVRAGSSRARLTVNGEDG